MRITCTGNSESKDTIIRETVILVVSDDTDSSVSPPPRSPTVINTGIDPFYITVIFKPIISDT